MNGSIDALAAVRRSGQIYYAQVADKTTLACGVALTCPRYPDYPDGNQLREMMIPAGRSLADCFEEVRAFYAEQNLRCHRWVPAAAQPIEPVEAFLSGKGYIPVRKQAFHQAREAEIAGNPGVRLLPARAMRKALREIILNNAAHAPSVRETLADVTADRLDDPQYDLFVALLDHQPAGHGALCQVGEIGRIEDVFVAEAHRRRRVGSSIMNHLLALSRRLAMRITCLEAREENRAAQALFAGCGFEAGDSLMEFVAP